MAGPMFSTFSIRESSEQRESESNPGSMTHDDNNKRVTYGRLSIIMGT